MAGRSRCDVQAAGGRTSPCTGTMQFRDKWTSHPRTGAAAFRATARPCVSHGPTTSLAQELQTCGGLLGSLKGVEGPGSRASKGRGPTHQGKCGGEGALGPQWAQRRPLSHHSHAEAGERHAGLRSWVRSKATTGRREEGQHAEDGLAIPTVLVAQLRVHRGMTVLGAGAGARAGPWTRLPSLRARRPRPQPP